MGMGHVNVHSTSSSSSSSSSSSCLLVLVSVLAVFVNPVPVVPFVLVVQSSSPTSLWFETGFPYPVVSGCNPKTPKYNQVNDYDCDESFDRGKC